MRDVGKVFDENVVLTGANLSEEYFTTRQDRYMLFQNTPVLSDLLSDFFMVLSKYAYSLRSSSAASTATATIATAATAATATTSTEETAAAAAATAVAFLDMLEQPQCAHGAKEKHDIESIIQRHCNGTNKAQLTDTAGDKQNSLSLRNYTPDMV